MQKNTSPHEYIEEKNAVNDNGSCSRPTRRRNLAKSLKSGSLNLIKGLRRSTSSSSASSCDSMYSSDDDVAISKFNSCMKGSRHDEGNAKCQRRVRFRSSRNIAKVHKVEPLFGYTEELWWSKDEIVCLKNDQACFSKDDGPLVSQAQAYLRAYITARHQVFKNTDGEDQKKQCKPSLSGDVYNALVLGRSRGFGALEIYCPESKVRQERVSKIIALTTAAYYDCVTLQNMENADKVVRAYSRTMTEADRYWAVAIGSVDSAAATDFFTAPSCQQKYITGTPSSRLVHSSSMKKKSQALCSHAA